MAGASRDAKVATVLCALVPVTYLATSNSYGVFAIQRAEHRYVAVVVVLGFVEHQILLEGTDSRRQAWGDGRDWPPWAACCRTSESLDTWSWSQEARA